MIGDPVPLWEETEGNEEEELTYLMSNAGQPAPTVLFLYVLRSPRRWQADKQVTRSPSSHTTIPAQSFLEATILIIHCSTQDQSYHFWIYFAY